MRSANSVSRLPVFVPPSELSRQTVVEATAMKRAQAHRRLLRNVKLEVERVCEQEKVKGQINKVRKEC
jgi:hypothetical protein